MPKDFPYATPGEAANSRAILRLAKQASLALTVDSGGTDYDLEQCTDYKAIAQELSNASEVDLTFYTRHGRGLLKRKRIGMCSLVFGNDPSGEELIADYSAPREPHPVWEAFLKLADDVIEGTFEP